jgi:pilus assembly protein CpaB
MRSKTVILLLLALGCGLVASIGISQILQRQDQTPAGDTAPVWVVLTDIKRNDPLTMENLKLEQWPKEKIPPGALGKLEEVDGKRARANLYAGEAVLDKKLLSKDEVAISMSVPKGFRLYTVQADAVSSQGGLLHPDDRVDVIVFVAKTTGIAQTGAKTILEDIRVFAVNDLVRTADDKAAESISAKTVTLLVTPTQAEKLTLANEIGKIRLVMRSGDDTGTVTPGGTRLSDVFTPEQTDRGAENIDHPPINPKTGLNALLDQSQQATQPQQTAQPQPVVPDQTFTMQVIRGTEISQLDFSRKMDDPSRWDNGSWNTSGSPAQSAPEAEQPKPENVKQENVKPAAEKTGGSKAPGAADAKAAGPNQDTSQGSGHS